MSEEPIKRYCCVCGKRLPGKLSVYELKDRGAASEFNDAQLIFHCIAQHTKEQIAISANNPPKFRRASE
jgi:hypothetical protein